MSRGNKDSTWFGALEVKRSKNHLWNLYMVAKLPYEISSWEPHLATSLLHRRPMSMGCKGKVNNLAELFLCPSKRSVNSGDSVRLKVGWVISISVWKWFPLKLVTFISELFITIHVWFLSCLRENFLLVKSLTALDDPINFFSANSQPYTSSTNRSARLLKIV